MRGHSGRSLEYLAGFGGSLRGKWLRDVKSLNGSTVNRERGKSQSATVSDGLAEVCQRSLSSHDDGAADGTTGLAGHKVRALVRGEAASSASVPARSADNGPGIHMAKIAVGT